MLSEALNPSGSACRLEWYAQVASDVGAAHRHRSAMARSLLLPHGLTTRLCRDVVPLVNSHSRSGWIAATFLLISPMSLSSQLSPSTDRSTCTRTVAHHRQNSPMPCPARTLRRKKFTRAAYRPSPERNLGSLTLARQTAHEELQLRKRRD